MARKKLTAPLYFINTRGTGLEADFSELICWADGKALEWNLDAIITCKMEEIPNYRKQTQRLLFAVADSEVQDLTELLQKPASQRPDILIFEELPRDEILLAVKERMIYPAISCESCNKKVEKLLPLVDILILTTAQGALKASSEVSECYPEIQLVQLNKEFSIREAINALSMGMNGIALQEIASYPEIDRMKAIQNKLKAVRDYRNVSCFLEDRVI